MNKRKLVVLITAVVVVAASIFIFFDTNLLNREQQTAKELTNKQALTGTEPADTRNQADNSASGSGQDSTVADTVQQPSEMQTDSLINNEKVDVGSNTPEYELSLELCENRDNKTFIRMQYYLNGSAVVNELGEDDLPELAGIFESRAQESGNTEAYRIKQALLNPVHSQLYLLIQGVPFEIYTQSSFYMVNLNDMSIKKLFSYPGLYGKMSFNRDFSLLAWSFGDPPVMSMHQEDNLLEVLDCSSGDYIIKGNVYSPGKRLGSNSNPELLYDYEFVGWQSVDVLKLKQAVRPLSDPDSGLTQTDVLYDIKKNLLLNTDGSELKQPVKKDDGKPVQDPDKPITGDTAETGSAINMNTDTQDKLADNEPVKVLKSFYSYLGSEKDYAKAMQLLDSDFKLRLGMLKQFGTEEIIKSDIDSDSASIYSELLRAARLDSITSEETKGDICTILYNQTMDLGNETQLKQAMSAQVKKSGKVWKIILIEDGIQ